MRARSYDAEAARQILATGSVSPALVREAAQAVGAECPECGSRDTEDNGGTEYRCRVCDHRWGTDSGERYGF